MFVQIIQSIIWVQTLIVSFYTRLHETRGVVAVIVNSPPTNSLITPGHIRGLADILISQCQLARLILASGWADSLEESELAIKMRETMIQRIDTQLASAKKVFPNAESFSAENESDPLNNSGLAVV
jgi:hypothetical protein